MYKDNNRQYVIFLVIPVAAIVVVTDRTTKRKWEVAKLGLYSSRTFSRKQIPSVDKVHTQGNRD
jgi:hypothetical protein